MLITRQNTFIICVFAFAILANILTLKDGHNWGDDFCQYIIHSENIIHGKAYASGIMLDSPVVYPPGFPFLLLPVLKIAGLNFKALKCINIFSWFLAILFLYPVLRRYCGRGWTQASVILLSLSSFFFVFKQNILSDIPFFLFICSSFYFFEKSQDGRLRLYFASFLLSLSMALWTRAAGNILFMAAGFYFLLVKRDFTRAGWVLLVYGINEVLLFYWVGFQPGFLSTIEKVPHIFFLSVFYNLPTAYKSLWYFFCPPLSPVATILFNTPQMLLDITAPCLYAIMFWLFVRRLQKRTLTFIDTFSFFYLSMVIFWLGFTIPVDWTVRYIFPLLPMVFVEGRRILQWAQGKYFVGIAYKLIFCLLVASNTINMASQWHFNDDALNQRGYQQLVAWVKHSLKPNEHYMFWKARCMAMLTGRVGTVYWLGMVQQPAFEKRVEQLHISYVLLSNSTDSRFIAVLQHVPLEWQGVWTNDSYTVFKNLKISGA